MAFGQSGPNLLHHTLANVPHIFLTTSTKAANQRFKAIVSEDKDFNGCEYKIRTYEINASAIVTSPYVIITCVYQKIGKDWQCVAARVFNQMKNEGVGPETTGRVVTFINLPPSGKPDMGEWSNVNGTLVSGTPKWATASTVDRSYVYFALLDEHFAQSPVIAVEDAIELFRVLVDVPISDSGAAPKGSAAEATQGGNAEAKTLPAGESSTRFGKEIPSIDAIYK